MDTGPMTTTPDLRQSAEVSAGSDGRLTIPAQIRRAANIEPGRTLIAYVDKGRVVLEERSHLIKRIQEETIAAVQASGTATSLADDLIAERRAEAVREDTRP